MDTPIPDYDDFQYNYTKRDRKDKPIEKKDGSKEILHIEYFPSTEYTLNEVISWIENNVGSDYVATITVHGFTGRAREARTKNTINDLYNSTYDEEFLDTLYSKFKGEETTASMDLDSMMEDDEFDLDEYLSEMGEELDNPAANVKLSGGKMHYDILTITDQYRPSIIRSGIKEDTLGSFIAASHYAVTIRYFPRGSAYKQ